MFPKRIKPLHITDSTLVTALGRGRQANWDRIRQGQSGLKPCDFPRAENLQTWIGEVEGLDRQVLAESLADYDCRNNRLSSLALEQDDFLDSVERLKKTYGCKRVGVFVGTSTSGIQSTESAYEVWLKAGGEGRLPSDYHYQTTHAIGSTSEFVRAYLGLSGIFNSVSTACSSSAKVFASAQRAIAAGFCDAAIVGGVDSLCLTTLHGFHSLQVTASDICRPSDKNRSGISIGEAAGFAILEKQPNAEAQVCLLGYGESGDAYHMSSPHPEGLGAAAAMRDALARAGRDASDVDYVNLHGTGTLANDAAEANAVKALLGEQVACSSTKGWTGHTLGAAGIVEAIIAQQSLADDYLPQSLNTLEVDPDISINILQAPLRQKNKLVLSNSFGFGGSNCCLAIGDAASVEMEPETEPETETEK